MNRREQRTIFMCQECGAQTPKWEGRCPQCGQWNTIVNAPVPSPRRSDAWLGAGAVEVQELSQVSPDTAPRITTSFEELDLVLGGGIVPGSLVLLAGDPG